MLSQLVFFTDGGYSSGDPGIVYNTVSILMDEFVEEYRRIRYGETDKVIKYFEEELKRIGKKLNLEEEDLTKYNVEKRIINYIDETKEIAAISKEYELREQDALFAFSYSSVCSSHWSMILVLEAPSLVYLWPI